jgi:hypothetical protein
MLETTGNLTQILCEMSHKICHLIMVDLSLSFCLIFQHFYVTCHIKSINVLKSIFKLNFHVSIEFEELSSSMFFQKT